MDHHTRVGVILPRPNRGKFTNDNSPFGALLFVVGALIWAVIISLVYAVAN